MSDSTVAATILTQLGGVHAFRRMTGVRDLVYSDNSLSMRLPGIARCDGKRCSGLRIVLDPSDTYTVEVVAVRNLERKVLATISDVYAENLREVFTRLTGLETHMPKVVFR